MVSWALITAPQTEQVWPSVRPSSVQVASRPEAMMTVWPVAGMVSWATSTCPQTEHLLPSVRPSSVQVAALLGMGTGKWAGIFSMTVMPHAAQVHWM